MSPRYIVRLGDTSDHGGAVITSCAHWFCRGQLVARIGDLLACPIHGPNAIVEGSPNWSCEGSPIARQGDLTECGARLIALQSTWSCN